MRLQQAAPSSGSATGIQPAALTAGPLAITPAQQGAGLDSDEEMATGAEEQEKDKGDKADSDFKEDSKALSSSSSSSSDDSRTNSDDDFDLSDDDDEKRPKKRGKATVGGAASGLPGCCDDAVEVVVAVRAACAIIALTRSTDQLSPTQ